MQVELGVLLAALEGRPVLADVLRFTRGLQRATCGKLPDRSRAAFKACQRAASTPQSTIPTSVAQSYRDALASDFRIENPTPARSQRKARSGSRRSAGGGSQPSKESATDDATAKGNSDDRADD